MFSYERTPHSLWIPSVDIFKLDTNCFTLMQVSLAAKSKLLQTQRLSQCLLNGPSLALRHMFQKTRHCCQRLHPLPLRTRCHLYPENLARQHSSGCKLNKLRCLNQPFQACQMLPYLLPPLTLSTPDTGSARCVATAPPAGSASTQHSALALYATLVAFGSSARTTAPHLALPPQQTPLHLK
jgi:hypothetical protein